MESVDQLALDAKRVVAALTGYKVVRVWRISGGVMTYKYAVQSDRGQKYVARFYPSNRAFLVDYEPELVMRCRDLGIRVPEVTGNSKSGPKSALEYMVYQMLPGCSMQERVPSLSDDTLAKICQALIAELELLGKVPIDGFGGLIDAEHGRFESWVSFVENAFTEGIEVGRQSPFMPKTWLESIEVIGGRLQKLAYDGPPQLCWGDVSPENIILDNNDNLAGLVDFEGVVSAEMQLNHGYVRAQFTGTRFWAAFDREWRASAGIEASHSALYVLVRALRILRYAREPLPTGVQRLPISDFLPGLQNAITEAMDLVNKG